MLIDGSANCSWIIEGDQPDDRVTLTFTSLEFSASDYEEECDDIYLEVLDGGDFDAPSLYKACRGGTPPALTSRGNAMIVQAVANHYYGNGFRAIFDLSSSACGGTLTNANGSFISPNYPNGYPANVECIWVVRAAPGNHVQMSFRRFDIEPSEFCNSDFVEIHEGSAGGPLLGHFCGNEIPSNITAVGTLWVLFRSNGEGQAPGFWADFTLLHGVELSGSHGSIASPMYPEAIRGTGTFTWRVTVNETYGIRISFLHYEMDAYNYGENCEDFDTIKIYDGFDETAPVLLTACSRTMPEPVTSTGNVVYIKYTRHGWFTEFLLKWQQSQASFGGAGAVQSNITGCGGNFIVDNNVTTLISPDYPLGHHGALNCSWSFEAPSSYRIRLKVIALSVDSHPSCIFDRVELYDGVRGLPTYQLNKTICQSAEQNNTYLSSGRFLRLTFIKGEQGWLPGFNFSLTTECGGYVRGPAGSISSPNYPDNYEASKCIWKVVVRPGRTIRLNFLPEFEIYSSGGQCVTDQLILRSGANEESPFLGSGRYCGGTTPTNLETSANHLYVHFTSMTHGGKGFGFKYEEVSLGCGGTFQLNELTPGKNIQSPNHPQMPPPSTECEWIFTVAQGEAVQINFLEPFDITRPKEPWWNCETAGVEVRNGATSISPELGKFCEDIPGTVKSTGNSIYIRYYTNVQEPRNGFKAEVQIATCGGVHSGYHGTIAYPSLPELYELSQDCLWTVRVRRGSGVTLEFRSFNLGLGNDNCTTGDKLIITEKGSSPDMMMLNPNPRNWTFCGNFSQTVETAGNEIRIRFVNDGLKQATQGRGLGFQIRYTARYEFCQADLETPSGVVTSPLYPQNYPSNHQCNWFIHAPAGRRIRLEFTDFELEGQFPRKDWRWNCTRDYFIIFQGARTEVRAPLYNTSLCGTSLPPPVESTGGELTLYFGSDGAIAGRGFKVSYTTELPLICGGSLEGGEGVITSPNSTTGTPNETNGVFCEWKTGVGSGSGGPLPRNNGTLIITLHRLQLPSWATETKDPYCNDGFLRFTPGDDELYGGYKWRRLCGSIRDEKMYLPGSSLVVLYISDDVAASFNMSYQIAPCGDKLQGPEENLTSLNYPSPYPTNTECIWTVEFTPGSQVKVTFYDLDLDDHQGPSAEDGCDRDFITIRNGKYPSSPQLGKFCGSYLPTEIISMSNHLWIEFHSDGSGDGNRRGFNLGLEELSKGCGGVVHTRMGRLTSPVSDSGGGAGGRYPDNNECEWIIQSIPGYSVNLVFTDRFDLETSANCSNDYVEVFEKVSLDWVSRARFCGRQMPPPLNMTGESVKVVFKSNANINGDGFKLYWYSSCGGVFKESSGVIRSSHYERHAHMYHVNPGQFQSYMGWESDYLIRRCDYLVTGDPDDYILIQYLEPFEIRVPAHWALPLERSEVDAGCPRVHLTMWQGNLTNVERLGVTACGEELPEPFVARGSVVLAYNYMGHYENYGFRAKFSRFECGGEITTPRRVHSPGHPFTSTSNMNCTWVVRGPPDKVVRFTFLFLEMEFHRQCDWDSVRLYDGPLIDETKRIGTYCGNLTEDLPKISSRSNSMTIYFMTDIVIEHRGFEGAVEFSPGEDQGCGGTKNLTLGQVTLTNLDTRENNLDCQWLLVTQQFKSVQLTFTSFDLGGNLGTSGNSIGSCQSDYVEIRDGPGPHGQLLAKLCGSVLPSPIISSLHFMWVRFVTDGSRHARGFNFTAREITSPCGQPVYSANETWQYLTSPGYPSNYGNNVHCRWRVDATAEYEEVDIKFNDLEIEASPGCLKDGLEIMDVSNSYFTPEGITGPILFTGNGISDWKFRNLNLTRDSIYQKFKYCGSETPPDFFSVGQSAEIVFHADGSTTRKGFKLGFKVAGCNRTYEKMQGRIFSPKWPGSIPLIANCFSTIVAPNGSNIALYVNAFSLPILPGETGCTETALQFRDGSPSGPILAQYCGTSIPDPVFSMSNILYLQFFSRNQFHRREVTRMGYDITYTTTDMGRGCGGNIFHTGGGLTSPLYPGNYSQDKDCVWRIRVPAGLRVQLQFTNFMFGGDCQTNFVEISSLDSHDPSAAPVLFSRYCSGDFPGIYNGDSDMAVIRYKTSTSNSGAGWRLLFKGVYPSNVPISSQ